MPTSLVNLTARLVNGRAFQTFIIATILLNATVIGMETYAAMVQRWGTLLHTIDRLCLSIFVVEIVLKLIACGRHPREFFRSGWNVFDFVVVAAAFIPGLSAQSTILRMIRLLRVLRLLSSVPSMQILVLALLHSIPRIGQMSLLAALLFYVYAVIGTSLFAAHDPTHWGSLHIGLLSLFRTLTLEDWTDLMYTGMELYPWAWVFFVSFVLLATFIVFNMLIGIILSSMEDARGQILQESAEGKKDNVEVELVCIRDSLKRLEAQMNKLAQNTSNKKD